MGYKIFVSYKFEDYNVRNLESCENSTARSYVNKIEEKFNTTDDIYKGEENNEDLSALSDATIWKKLKNRIYDSTITIILISPNMKEKNKRDRDQWIPWEVSYSLRETSRIDKNGKPITSRTNAMLGVVLPDANGSYEYYQKENNCCVRRCTTYDDGVLFQIIRQNMFNAKEAYTKKCIRGELCWYKGCSYIDTVIWDDFIEDCKKYINDAEIRKKQIKKYNIVKEV